MTNLKKEMMLQAAAALEEAAKASGLAAGFGDRVVAICKPVEEQVTYIHPGSRGFTINIAGTAEHLKLLFKSLATEGWRCTSDRPEDKKPSWWGWFDHAEIENISIYVNFSSTICRRVKIGTELKEVDIYDTVCGEQTQVAPDQEQV